MSGKISKALGLGGAEGTAPPPMPLDTFIRLQLAVALAPACRSGSIEHADQIINGLHRIVKGDLPIQPK